MSGKWLFLRYFVVLWFLTRKKYVRDADSSESDDAEDLTREDPFRRRHNSFNKFWLLIWKNFMLQYRHPVQTVIQFMLPVVFSALLVLIRSFILPVIHPDNTTYIPLPIATLEPLR